MDKKKKISDDDKGPPPPPIGHHHRILASLTAGAWAGALAKTTIAPLDRTKIYFQTTPTSTYSLRAVLSFLRRTYRATGFTSLFRGNSATMARIVPYSAIQFAAHEQWKNVLSSYGLHGSSPQVSRFLAGALAGITAQSLTYPLDLSRARLAVSSKGEYKNLPQVLVKVYSERGVRSLYHGITPTILGVIPYAGFSFYTYESLKKGYRDRNEGREADGWIKLCFGALSGILGQTSSYPMDIVRRRRQVGLANSQDISSWALLKQIYHKEGVKGGLYKGLSMNWIKGPIAAGISFSVYDTTYALLLKWIQM